MGNLELSALRILTRGAVAGAADAALTASMGWVRPPFRPRSRHQRVLGGRHVSGVVSAMADLPLVDVATAA